MSDKAAYIKGQHASLDGFPHHMNPFREPMLRQSWSSGWSNPMLPFSDYAQAIEARSGETGTGSIRQDESAVPAGDAPNTDGKQPGDEK